MRPSRDRCRTGRALVVAVLLSGLVGACEGQEAAEITFIVKTADSLASDAEIFIAGSVDTLGAWHPRGLPLHRTDATTWRGTAAMPVDSNIEFKVTQGLWQNEALDADGSVPPNRHLRVTRDTTVRIDVSAWKQGRELQVTGTVGVHRNFSAAGLEPRDISVWLPPGYEENQQKRYPVLYAQDGQNLFDPVTSAFGVDWQLDESADSLITAGRIREVIIVGINNTTNRSREYHDTPLGATYQSFVVDVVKPFIDETYRTLSDPGNTAVIGSSSGGLAAFLLLWNHPEVFSMAACLSPYFPPSVVEGVGTGREWQGDGQKLYIDNGGDELDTRLQEGVEEMLAMLRSKEFERRHELLWIRYPDDGHNESAWGARVWRPLEYLFGTD